MELHQTVAAHDELLVTCRYFTPDSLSSSEIPEVVLDSAILDTRDRLLGHIQQNRFT